MPTANDSSDIKNFVQKYPILTFDSGERLIRPRELETDVILIKSGVVRLYATSKEGKEIAITCLIPTEYKNLVLGLDGNTQRYYAEAVTRVEIWRAPKKDFLAYAAENLKVYEELSASLLIMIKDLYYQIEWLKKGNAYNKVATLIYNIAKNLGVDKNNARQVEIKTTHQDLATLSGLTRETITTQMNRLRKKKIVVYQDSTIIVQDMNTLREESGFF